MEDKEDNNEVKEYKTSAYIYKHDDEIINKYIKTVEKILRHTEEKWWYE